MKLKFWKNRKSDLTANVTIDAAVVERRLHEGQIANLAKCGRFVRVEHYPEHAGFDLERFGKYPWVATFSITLFDKTGLHYGYKGVEIVNEVGLPGNLNNIKLVAENNGRNVAVVKSANCPTPPQITRLAQEVERATTEILDEYRRFETMGRLHKPRKGSKA